MQVKWRRAATAVVTRGIGTRGERERKSGTPAMVAAVASDGCRKTRGARPRAYARPYKVPEGGQSEPPSCLKCSTRPPLLRGHKLRAVSPRRSPPLPPPPHSSPSPFIPLDVFIYLLNSTFLDLTLRSSREGNSFGPDLCWNELGCRAKSAISNKMWKLYNKSFSLTKILKFHVTVAFEWHYGVIPRISECFNADLFP